MQQNSQASKQVFSALNRKNWVGISVLIAGAWALQSGLGGCRSQEDPSVAPEPRTPAGSDMIPNGKSPPVSPAQGSMGNANAAQGKSAPGVNTDASAEKGTEKPKPPPRFFGGSKAAAIDWPDDPPAAAPQAPQQQQNAAPVQGKSR